jgi:hypothetical protein
MGDRDDELSGPPAAAELEEAEAATRRLLARYGQPSPALPPRDLAARAMVRLQAAQPPRNARRRAWGLLPLLAGLSLLLGLGLWGVLGDSAGPASLLGGGAGGAGRALLLLTLAAKPLVNLLLAAGPLGLGLLALGFVGGLIWWRLVAVSQPAALLERQL